MTLKPGPLPPEILRQIEKPARYVGGEWNAVVKAEPADISFALCFPDLYELGMSNLAVSILYQLLNARDDVACERVFAPAPDLRARLVEEQIALFGLESGRRLCDFDLVGFSIPYELAYGTVLDMLALGGVPLRSRDRGEAMPLVIGGGPCAVNIEPLADAFDLVVVGESEHVLERLIDCYKTRTSKTAFLREVASWPGIYVPAFYSVAYGADGRPAAFTADEGASLPVERVFVADFDDTFVPTRPIVPNLEIVHDRMTVELFRGCARGCRFCQAGMTYRPVRQRSVETLVNQAGALAAATGYDELGMLSLSSSDYEALGELTDLLCPLLAADKVNVSLPSLRLDTFDFELMEKAGTTRRAGLTFAPEAGTQRLRDAINKNISEDDLLKAAELAFRGGWHHLKLYFMLGLPGETDEDVDGIAELVDRVVSVWYGLPKEVRGRAPRIVVSTSYFIPKPWTPFQWEAQIEPSLFEQRQRRLADRLRHRFVKYQWHDPAQAQIEAVLARGDRRLFPVLVDVVAAGGTLDGWREHFSLARWQEALAAHRLSVEAYTGARAVEELLPWEIVSVGVTKRHLLREKERAARAELSLDCRLDCAGCGIARFGSGICLRHRKTASDEGRGGS